jgi:hypothetical protein
MDGNGRGPTRQGWESGDTMVKTVERRADGVSVIARVQSDALRMLVAGIRVRAGCS